VTRTQSRILRAVVAAIVLVPLAATGVAAGEPGAPYRVKDINSSGSSDPTELTAMGGKLYFSAKGGGKGRELWFSDGTAPGTQRILDIRPGPAGSDPLSLVPIGNKLFFTADDGAVGRELWVTDGTAGGTLRLTDENLGPCCGFPNGLTAVDGALLFFVHANDNSRLELWKSNGTPSGTVRIKRFADGIHVGTGPESPPTAFAHRAYFHLSHCAFNVCEGRGLWVSNGTATGTKHFFSAPGANTAAPIAAASSRLYWNDGSRLLRSNGTAASSKIMTDVQATQLAPVGDNLFFHGQTFDADPADDGLWVSLGTAATTTLLAELDSVTELTPLGGLLLFVSGTHLMVSDGTPGGTHVLSTDSNLGTLSNIAGTLYFLMDGALWATDGSIGGGYKVFDNVQGGPMTEVNGTGYFVSAGNGQMGGNELWRFVP